jgi:hypothetical protein
MAHFENTVDRAYELDASTSWREVDMTTDLLQELIRGMRAMIFGKQGSLFGFEMLDNNSRPIGVWYSVQEARTFVKMNSDGTVRIDSPPLQIYEMGENDSIGGRHMKPGY